MRYRKLGNRGLLVSEMCLGAMTFGSGEGMWATVAGVGQDGVTYSWCIDPKEQLGNGGGPSTSMPASNNAVADQLGAGADFGSANSHFTSSTVDCWGTHEYGNRGDGSTIGPVTPPSGLPSAVFNNGATEKLAVGADHACRISDGLLSCWGRNHRMQLGIEGAHLQRP